MIGGRPLCSADEAEYEGCDKDKGVRKAVGR